MQMTNKVITAILLQALISCVPQLVGAAKNTAESSRGRQPSTSGVVKGEKKSNAHNKLIAPPDSDEMLLAQASVVNTDVNALKKILFECKTGATADKAFKLLMSINRNESNAFELLIASKAYVIRFPEREYAKEAKRIIEEIDWLYCENNKNEESYKQYLVDNPEGRHYDEVHKSYRQLHDLRAKEKDTIEEYEEFLRCKDKYPGRRINVSIEEGDAINNATARLVQLKYEKARRSDLLEDWKDLVSTMYFHSVNRREYPMLEEGARKIEQILYDKIALSPTLMLCNEYLERYVNGEYYAKGIYGPIGLHWKEVMKLREPFIYDLVLKYNTESWYYKYLQSYPVGYQSADIRTKLEPSLYNIAKNEDWHDSYERYLSQCPDGKNISKVKARLEYLRTNTAIAEIEYPKELEAKYQWRSQSEMYWEWETILKERSGKVPFKVAAKGYILDKKGYKWVLQGIYDRSQYKLSRNEIVVPAGGEKKDIYRLYNNKHEICGGTIIFTWVGEDSGGHPITIEEKVKLHHADCPLENNKNK